MVLVNRATCLRLLPVVLMSVSVAYAQGMSVQPNQNLSPEINSSSGASVNQLSAATAIPSFVRPGVSLLYESGSSSEPDDSSKNVSAGVGALRYNVVAIAGDRVFVDEWGFLQGFNNPAAISFMSLSSMAVSAEHANSGAAMWMPLAQLQSLQSGGGVDVTTGSHQVGGQNYNTKVVTIKAQNALERMQFDTGTGLKLTQQNASGRARRSGGSSPFNLKNQSYLLFKTFRQVSLPWLGSTAPAWVGQVQSLSYTGTHTTGFPGTQSYSQPLEITASIEQRGVDWMTGTMTRKMPGQNPASIPYVTGQGSIGGLWINADALAKMKPGVIDRDTMLGSTLSYAVATTPHGRVGVVTDAGNLGGYKLSWTYRLSDGVLLRSRIEDPGMYAVTEMALSAIR